MRTTKSLLLTLALALFATVAFAQITGTLHDFSGAAWNDASSGEICNACHSPHQGDVTAVVPLWSRATTAGAFAAYTSPTFNADDTGTDTDGTGAAYTATPSGVSLLCLTCHDGVSKLDYTGVATTTMTDIAAWAVRNGGADEHPISIDYNANLISADGGLHTVATASERLSAQGTVECSSCHDVHNSANIDGGSKLLAASNAGSDMCLTCHIK
ncbi:cytochrome c3 family protein [Aestuariivivens sediminicola]|uniref:cytochrome c3 family protein n=1 Tax=Aestuariivivens sediminicola TaxID=2913560 RepID=UPI001F56751E|nr:cytochrome c3 family protein [Aestuariivivens sediminicola]